MRILFATLGDETLASSRTRVFQYLPHLRRAGVAVEVFVYGCRSSFLGRRIIGPITEHLHRCAATLELLARACRADVVFLQKIFVPALALRLLRMAGKRLVFDFDDAVYTVQPEASPDSARQARALTRQFEQTVSRCDLVVLENEFTEARAARLCPKVLRITGPIDTERYLPASRPAAADVTIGWIGSLSTTVYLRLVAKVLSRLKTEVPGLRVLLIGAGPAAISAMEAEVVPWRLDSEVAQLSRFDIGIMPLTDDEWTRGKGGYKVLQYMAMGIPAVASPVGVNREMINDGVTGFLAADEEAWAARLRELALDASRRQMMGRAAREEAQRRYSFFAATPRLLEALAQLHRRPERAARCSGTAT